MIMILSIILYMLVAVFSFFIFMTECENEKMRPEPDTTIIRIYSLFGVFSILWPLVIVFLIIMVLWYVTRSGYDGLKEMVKDAFPQ